MRAVGLRRDVAAQQVAAVRVGDGQRIAARSVGSAEVPLEAANGVAYGGVRTRGLRACVSPARFTPSPMVDSAGLTIERCAAASFTRNLRDPHFH